MTDLSPQAQAVLDAYWKSPWDPCLQHEDRHAIAAALETLADEVVPEEDWPDQSIGFANWNLATERCEQRKAIRNQILSISAELRHD